MQANLVMSGIIVKEVKLNFSKSVSKMKKVKILKNYPESRIKIDVACADALVRKLDK